MQQIYCETETVQPDKHKNLQQDGWNSALMPAWL